MPFYEYRRPDGTTIEVMQKMTDPPMTHDPDSGVPLERVFHPIAVHFKGKGFYNTDYGTKNRAREKAETDSANKKSESASKSESTSSSAEKSGDASKTESSKAAETKGSSSSPAKSSSSSTPSSKPSSDS